MEEYKRIIAIKDNLTKNWEDRIDVINSLIELGTEEAIDIICDLLVNDSNSSVRIRAASVLNQTNNPRIVDCLLKALEDWDSGVRLIVLKTLNEIEIKDEKQIVPALLKIRSKEHRININHEITKILEKYE